MRLIPPLSAVPNAFPQNQRSVIKECEIIASNQMKGAGVDARFRQYRRRSRTAGDRTGPAQAAVPD